MGSVEEDEAEPLEDFFFRTVFKILGECWDEAIVLGWDLKEQFCIESMKKKMIRA